MKNTLYRGDLVVIAATDIVVWNGRSMRGVQEPETVNEVKHLSPVPAALLWIFVLFTVSCSASTSGSWSKRARHRGAEE